MRRASFFVMFLLSLLVSAYAIGMYGFRPGVEHMPLEFRDSFGSRPVAVAAHIFASAAALVLGPVQFMPQLRTRWPTFHKIVGRAYLALAVPVGGLAGLYLSGFAFGGIASRLGFGLLAVAWLYTAFRGFIAIQSRELSAHRRWMIRNFSLTFAAVTLRLYLPITQFLGVPFELSYQIVSWMAWVPNLMVGELLVRAARLPSVDSPVSQPGV